MIWWETKNSILKQVVRNFVETEVKGESINYLFGRVVDEGKDIVEIMQNKKRPKLYINDDYSANEERKE